MNKQCTGMAVLSLLQTASMVAAPQTTTDKRPNIILFLVDDMGWQDTSVPFWTERTIYNDAYHTPAMQQLARKGVVFTNAYASAVSSPTRTSLMTGMNPAAHRVTNWTLFKNKPTDNKKEAKLLLPDWNYNGLQPLGANVNNSVEALTFPQLLQSNGYTTIHCGKAHWGVKDTPGASPLNLGFDVNIAGYEGGAPASYLAAENFGFDENGVSTNKFAVPGLEKYWGKDLFLTEILTIEAKQAIDTAITQNKPFYLYMSHYAIHTPHDSDNRYYQKYIDKGMDDLQARYASLIEGMDKSLGDLMNHLDEKGIADNTVILFMSDNGGLTRTARSGVPDTQNYPLNAGKGSAYEGGVRVPMMAYYPNVTPKGTRCASPIDIADFFPSILEIAGVRRYHTPQTVHGQSFATLLSSPQKQIKQFADRALIFHFPNRWINMPSPSGNGYGAYSSIIQKGWKLIYYYETEQYELFDLNNDIAEKTNLANTPKGKKRQQQLATALTTQLKKMNAQLPTKPDGTACHYPE